LTERSFAPAALQEAVDFYCRYTHMPLPIETVRSNRLAQNALLQAFCAQEKIPILDLTPPLEREVEAGHEMYFPDDTHWNAAGHDLAARELAKFLDLQP
jgi:lysophospholipase L1-like esterase